MSDREQQKLFLTPEARKRLRDEARVRGSDMSDVAEHLINEGEYPPEQKDEDA